MFNQKAAFAAAGKACTFYAAEGTGAPLVVLNNYSGDGASVARAAGDVGCPDCNLLVVSKLDWDRDMTPWYCPPIAPGDSPCEGGADAYLDLLLTQILPVARERCVGSPAFVAIAGYSLGGLFALYATYRCRAFSRVASMSGSLWFPDFVDFATKEPMAREPERLYLSLGDHEARTRNPYLRTVQDNTQRLVDLYRERGLDVTFELNPGNHFKQPALRTAKGIAAILR